VANLVLLLVCFFVGVLARRSKALPDAACAANGAADHRLAPGLAAALIAVGVPLSLVTVPVWWHVMGLL
jgi:predicted permease